MSFHAKGPREEAEAARLRSVSRREQSKQAIEALREQPRLSGAALSRHLGQQDRNGQER